jgi:hypothetical protein
MKIPLSLPPRFLFLAAGLAAAVAGLLVLYFFDPATAGFYPVCPLHEATGLQCPGCGGLRALHQLTHGHLAAAWGLNPLAVLLPPVTLALSLWEGARMRAGRPWIGQAARPAYGWAAAAGLVLFGVLRNLR